MYSLTDEIRMNHSVLTAPTVARYLALDADGTVRFAEFAWPDPTDRNGDGEAEAEAFLEASRSNGFHVSDITAWGEIGPGIPRDIPGDSIRVYRADDGAGDVQFFGLAVVPTDIYWDRQAGESRTVTR